LFVTRQQDDKIIIGIESKMLGILEQTSESYKSNCLAEVLQRCNYRLRPKAVILTLFARLFLADLFVHGIGGAFYEYITDFLLENYYRIKGLGFGIAAATVLLPFCDFTDKPQETITRLKQQLRQLNFNPENFIENSLCKTAPAAALISAKKNLIRSAGSRTLSTEAKKLAWRSIAEINDKLLKYAESSRRKLTEEIKLLENHNRSKEVLNYREYFFGLFPQNVLKDMTKIRGE
jgi:hypothetical protein